MVVLIAAAIVVAVRYKSGQNIQPVQPVEPLIYEVDESLVSVAMKKEAFEGAVRHFGAMAIECGRNPSLEHLTDLQVAFNGKELRRYTFTYLPDSQAPNALVVSVLPNTFGYDSVEAFRSDFDQCYAGGDRYPSDLNDRWLMFVSGCGTGFSDDSGRPIGCVEASDLVYPTLELR